MQAVVKNGTSIEVTGVAGAFRKPAAELDCGNSGSTMRMLAGLIAPHPHTCTMIGDESLTIRPMERIRKPLSSMGAKIDLTEGHAPMTIHGGPLKAIDFETPIPSAQVKTAVLFAGLQAEGTTSLSEAVRTRDHSEHALKAFGASLTRTEERLQHRRRTKTQSDRGRLCLGTSLQLHSFLRQLSSSRTRISCWTRWV